MYGVKETWKVVYNLPAKDWGIGGNKGVALVEAEDRQQAMQFFMQQYAGQFSTVAECKRLFS